MTCNSLPKKTSLYRLHKELGAKLGSFGGWSMPIEYSGIIREHIAVRTKAGLFDVSHMGEILITGPESMSLLQRITSNDVSKLTTGQIRYAAFLNESGGFVDDLLIHCMGHDRFFLCVNAGNKDKDFEHICKYNSFKTKVLDVSNRYVQLAIQGPKAANILQSISNVDLGALGYYRFVHGEIDGTPSIIARTGYTGEDGFEIYFTPDSAERIWKKINLLGKPYSMVCAGLGARNTLRLEARMALYGHEIDETITPWECGLSQIVDLDKDYFIGKEALVRQMKDGIKKKLIGFEMTGTGIGRDGYLVFKNNREIGWVSSGGPAPFLNKNIGLAFVESSLGSIGNVIDIQVRQRLVPAKIIKTPFYKRDKNNNS
ncbi:MAG: glycine cleavage system aminomethyltransferase GcvT [Acidobacteriia bacterium]|nr:glycine cleavage system aminomethyltransferase GcvT [Terriglobia bacterium]